MEVFKPEKKSYKETRIIGEIPEKMKESIRKRYSDLNENHLINLSEQDLQRLKLTEREKTPEEIELIKAADEEINKMMEELDIQPFNIPTDNVHVVSNYLPSATGKADPNRKMVLLDNDKCQDLAYFGAVAFHELFHLKGFHSVKVETREKTEGNPEGLLYAIRKTLGIKKVVESDTQKYRMGLQINTPVKKQERLDSQNKNNSVGYTFSFSGLEEAITAEMEKNYFKKLINDPVLKNQKEWLESDAAKKIKEEIAQKEKIPVEEIFSVTKDGKYKACSYPTQRKVLSLLTSEIYEKNKDRFASQNDVLKIFIKGHFTGKLLEISKLISDSFGNHGLKIAAGMTMFPEQAEGTYELLQIEKARQKIKNLAN